MKAIIFIVLLFTFSGCGIEIYPEPTPSQRYCWCRAESVPDYYGNFYFVESYDFTNFGACNQALNKCNWDVPYYLSPCSIVANNCE